MTGSKATSIEQIREHLARGGCVHGVNKWGHWQRVVSVSERNQIFFASPGWCEFDHRDVDHWELLPIEEEPKRQYYCSVSECCAEHSSDDTCICWHDEGTGPLRDRPEAIGRWRDKPLPGIDVKTLPILAEDPTGKWFRDSQKERMQRIRQSLLFGHYPSLDDLRDWWQATTGERIEWGRRCNYCDGNGNVPSEYYEGPCEACKDHPGYTVRPTWMGDKATGVQEDGQ